MKTNVVKINKNVSIFVSFIEKTILLKINVFEVEGKVKHLSTFCSNVQILDSQSFQNQKIHYITT